jgi:hypothetical protein
MRRPERAPDHSADDDDRRIALLRHLSTIAGLAVAVTGALALGAWQGPENQALPAGARPSVMAEAAPQPFAVFYLVESQAQVDQAARLELETARDAQGRIRILWAGTPEQERAAYLSIEELIRDAAGVIPLYIDMREGRAGQEP